MVQVRIEGEVILVCILVGSRELLLLLLSLLVLVVVVCGLVRVGIVCVGVPFCLFSVCWYCSVWFGRCWSGVCRSGVVGVVCVGSVSAEARPQLGSAMGSRWRLRAVAAPQLGGSAARRLDGGGAPR